MQITGTFKHQKVQMRNDGIDPAKVSDKIYYLEKGVQVNGYGSIPKDYKCWSAIVKEKLIWKRGTRFLAKGCVKISISR